MEECSLRKFKHSDDRSERLGIEDHSTLGEEAYKEISAYHAHSNKRLQSGRRKMLKY